MTPRDRLALSNSNTGTKVQILQRFALCTRVVTLAGVWSMSVTAWGIACPTATGVINTNTNPRNTINVGTNGVVVPGTSATNDLASMNTGGGCNAVDQIFDNFQSIQTGGSTSAIVNGGTATATTTYLY